jgi:hypothetical protein
MIHRFSLEVISVFSAIDLICSYDHLYNFVLNFQKFLSFDLTVFYNFVDYLLSSKT